jgi:hypothetical protein
MKKQVSILAIIVAFLAVPTLSMAREVKGHSERSVQSHVVQKHAVQHHYHHMSKHRRHHNR